MSDKVLWKGEFNYYGQCFTLYTRTYSNRIEDAFYNLCHQLAQKVGVSPQAIRIYLSDFDRCCMTKMNEKKEVIKDE